MKLNDRHKKRVRDYLGTALANKKKSYFGKSTKVGKERREALARGYKTSRKTGKSLDHIRRFGAYN